MLLMSASLKGYRPSTMFKTVHFTSLQSNAGTFNTKLIQEEEEKRMDGRFHHGV